MPLEKTYDLCGCKLNVFYDPKVVRISGNKALWLYLSQNIEVRTANLVRLIKLDYFHLTGKELLIENDSFAIEIWGHVYASYFAKAMKNMIKLKLIQDFADFIIKRSDTIDCGEQPVDSNRKFWDILAKFKGIILKFLPKKLRQEQVETKE